MAKKQPFVIKLSDENADWLFSQLGLNMKAWGNYIDALLDEQREMEAFAFENSTQFRGIRFDD